MNLKRANLFLERFFTNRRCIVLLIVIGFIVYANSLFNPFIGDDFGQLVNNPLVHSLLGIPKLFFRGTFYLGSAGAIEGNYYKPLMSVIFAAIYSLFGAHSFYYHLFQVSLHITNAILIFLLFKRYFRKNISFVLSLIFLVHPINAETVIYISDLQDVLFVFFGLLALLVAERVKMTPKHLLVVNALLFLSLLSKESGILFFLIYIIRSFLFDKKNYIKYTISLSTTLLIYLALRYISIGLHLNPTKVSPIMYESFTSRLIHIPSILSYYIKTFFFPQKLVILQNWIINQVSFSSFFLPLISVALFILILATLGVYIRIKDRQNAKYFTFFSIWLLAGLALHAQIIPLNLTVSERWFYFPEIGLLALIGLAITKLKTSSDLFLFSSLLILVIVIFALSARTIARNSNWSDPHSLQIHDLQLDPGNYMLEAIIGTEFSRRENFDQAEYHLQKAVSIFPESITVQIDLCTNYALRGIKYDNKEDLDKSERCFKKLVTKYDKQAIYLRLVKMLLQQNNYHDAKYYLQESLSKYPDDPESWYYLAQAELALGNKLEALEAITHSYRLFPTKQNKDLYLQLINE